MTMSVAERSEVCAPGEAHSTGRVLMCAPTAYALKYEINPWMSLANGPDTVVARRQWETLYRTISDVTGTTIELVAQAPNCPDMVFTANAGLVRGNIALLARFRHPQRQLEEAPFRKWFEAQGLRVVSPPQGCRFEGEGDALFAGDIVLSGYLKRSDIGAHRWISEALALPVLALQLTDDRWYHLDTCLFPLDARTVVYFPGAFDEYGCRVIENNFETIIVRENEALKFACNSVVLGRHVITPAGCPGLTATLQARGYSVHPVEMSEFLKAGGACKCLTLHLLQAGATG